MCYFDAKTSKPKWCTIHRLLQTYLTTCPNQKRALPRLTTTMPHGNIVGMNAKCALIGESIRSPHVTFPWRLETCYRWWSHEHNTFNKKIAIGPRKANMHDVPETQYRYSSQRQRGNHHQPSTYIPTLEYARMTPYKYCLIWAAPTTTATTQTLLTFILIQQVGLHLPTPSNAADRTDSKVCNSFPLDKVSGTLRPYDICIVSSRCRMNI